jgi:hypothetical protein
MSDRITKANLEARVENVNRRMEQRGSAIRYQVQGRNGYTALDRFTGDPADKLNLPDSVPGRGAGWLMLSTVTLGTKREVADFLHAMMVALDDSVYRA